jgi:major membrane immunogen (membrane-anchored lipoprotein)
MNNKVYILAAATALLAACSSSDKKVQTEADTTLNTTVSDFLHQDSTAKGVVTATGSMNGSNNSGVNSSDGIPQKADTSGGNN